MRVPNWLVVAAAALMALPFGWGLGVVAAYAIAGRNIGQLPALTVPVSIIAALIFAFSSILDAPKRLGIMAVGTALFILLAALNP